MQLPTIIFLDRDGTIIEDRGYPRVPGEVALLPGASQAIAAINGSGIPVVIVTNQSGIARGILTEQDYIAVHRRLEALLADGGARIDLTLHCPHHPEFTGPCECRKPGTLLFERAAAELEVDLRGAVFIGDRWRDVAPAIRAGGRGILIAAATTPQEELELASGHVAVVADLESAVEVALTGDTFPARSAGVGEASPERGVRGSA